MAAICYFLINTVSIAGVIAVTENRNLRKIWNECYFWSFPYYLVGGGIAALISVLNHRVGWQTVFLGLPVVYVIFRSYRLYLGKLESEKDHARADCRATPPDHRGARAGDRGERRHDPRTLTTGAGLCVGTRQEDGT